MLHGECSLLTYVLNNASMLTFIFLIGVPVGYFSSSLKELHGTLDVSTETGFKWLELSPPDSIVRFFAQFF